LILSNPKQRQSQGEEIANSISHGIRLVGALIELPFLIIHAVRHGNAGFIMKEKQNMRQEHGHHRQDQTLHPDKPAEENVLKDPVCDMRVDKDTPFHTEQGGEKIYFCSENCLKKFQKNPSA